MIDDATLKRLTDIGCTVTLCGSRVTCSVVADSSDYDYLVVAPDMQSTSDAVNAMSGDGFQWEGSEHYQNVAASDFMSWRKDTVNLIVTSSPEFARRHALATKLCKRFDLLGKQDRIALFQAVLYQEDYVK